MYKKKQHWGNVFTNKAPNEVSWFEGYTKISMEFLDLFANIIDIGGGDSNLVDELLDKGYQNIWVLDISGSALEKAKKRLGEKAGLIHWVVIDVTEIEPPVQFDFWHDRIFWRYRVSFKKRHII